MLRINRQEEVSTSFSQLSGAELFHILDHLLGEDTMIWSDGAKLASTSV